MAGLILKIIVINMSGKCILGPSFACLKKQPHMLRTSLVTGYIHCYICSVHDHQNLFYFSIHVHCMHFKIENQKPDTWFPQLSYSSLLASGGEFNKFYGSPQVCFFFFKLCKCLGARGLNQRLGS